MRVEKEWEHSPGERGVHGFGSCSSKSLCFLLSTNWVTMSKDWSWRHHFCINVFLVALFPQQENFWRVYTKQHHAKGEARGTLWPGRSQDTVGGRDATQVRGCFQRKHQLPLVYQGHSSKALQGNGLRIQGNLGICIGAEASDTQELKSFAMWKGCICRLQPRITQNCIICRPQARIWQLLRGSAHRHSFEPKHPSSAQAPWLHPS